MASNIYMRIGWVTVWYDALGVKCCDQNESHYAIIAKGNILNGQEATQ